MKTFGKNNKKPSEPKNIGMIDRDGKKVAPLEIMFSITREAPEPAKGDTAATPGWVSVSSETPVLSYIYFNEQWQRAYVILSHAPGAILGAWTKDGIALRDNHYGDTCGRLTPAYVRNGKLGGDKITWGTSERAQVIMRDVESGVRRNISVEGDWANEDLVLEGEKDGIPVIRASRWTPLAAAFVDVPADPNAGVARSLDAAAQDQKTNQPPTPPAAPVARSKAIMDEKELKERDALRAKENVEIFTLARDYNVPQDQVTRHITEGKSLADFQAVVLRDFSAAKAEADLKRTAEAAKVARTATDITSTIPAEKLAQFSFLRAICAMAKGMKPDLDIPEMDAGLEREVSQECVRLIRQNPEGKTYTPRGMCVPWNLVRANGDGAVRREFNVAGTGSNVVAQNLRPELFIDYLRAKLVLSNLGVTTLTGLVGDVLIPKQTSTASAGWIDEVTGGTSGAMAVGQVKLSPKTLGAYTDISRQLLLQSTPSADMLVMNDLVESLARSLQTGGLHGTGLNNQPTGLLTALSAGYQGYAAITEATVSSDGSPTYAEAEAMLALIEEANVDGLLKWAMRPKAFRYFKTLGRVGTTGFVPAGQEENGKKYVADLEVQTTTSLTSKYAVAGRWDSMVMALWGALDLTLDPYSLSTRGALRVVALQSADFGFRYLPAFGWSSKFTASV